MNRLLEDLKISAQEEGPLGPWVSILVPTLRTCFQRDTQGSQVA